MLNKEKDARIDTRLKYLRQKIMIYMKCDIKYEYHTALGVELELLNDDLEKKLIDTKEGLKLDLEKNIDSLSMTSAKTAIDLQVINSSGVQW